MANESRLPTINDLALAMAEFAKEGLGDQPVQAVVVPDSTMQALARAAKASLEPPPLMMEVAGRDGRMPLLVLSADRMAGARGGVSPATH